MVTTDPDDLKSEKSHVNKALEVCKYPRWAINKVAKCLNVPSKVTYSPSIFERQVGTDETFS